MCELTLDGLSDMRSSLKSWIAALHWLVNNRPLCVVRLRFVALLSLLPLSAHCALSSPLNSPVPNEWIDQNYLFTSYNEEPKHLDSASSYSNNETPWTYAVYEPPLKYHYLKRPYELIPRTLSEDLKVTYFDADGHVLSKASSQVTMSVFELHIKPGIRYQPHPAFAINDRGEHLYLNLGPAALKSISSPLDFAVQGSRELTAYDYAYAIKRLASPRLISPSYGFLNEKILGYDAYGAKLKSIDASLKSKAGTSNSFNSSPPWLDLRGLDFEGLETPDTYTLKIKIKGQYPQFKYWLAMTFFSPVPWEVDAFYSQPGMKEMNLSLDTWPVGTGPFMLTEHHPNAKMVLTKNPNYRGEPYPCEGEHEDAEKGLLKDCNKPTPFLEKIISIREKESTSLSTKFIQGYYDLPEIERGEPGVAFQVSIQDGTGLFKQLQARQIQLPSTVQVGLQYFAFNWLDPVVGEGKTPEQKERNRLLRQAITLAFDFDEYVAIFEQNRAKVNSSIVVPGLFGHEASPFNPLVYIPDAKGVLQRKSIEEAKKLLAQAGYSNGRDVKTGQPLILNYDTQGVGPGYKARLDWVGKQFAKLGIQLEIRNTDYNRFQDKIRKGSAQLFSWGWLADYPDPENFLFLLYGPNAMMRSGGENSSNYANPEYDALFAQMKDLDNTPERFALIGKMIEIIQKDAPMLFGWSQDYGGAYHQWVYNGKPSNIIRDQMSYLRIDPVLRRQKINEWNQAIWWPIWVIPFLIFVLVWPAYRVWSRRQNAKINDPAFGFGVTASIEESHT
jgi:ABC-type transport system substrate-binding protein